MAEDLSEDEVFANDVDPLEAIAKIRRDEGVPEEDIIVSDADKEPSQEDPEAVAAEEQEQEDEAELDNLQENKDEDDGTNDQSIDDVTNEDSKDETDDSDDNENTEDVPQTRKFTANGQEYEFTEQEILDQFETVFGKAVDYTQKTQKIAPFRKMISALEEENISAEQLNIAIDALKGNPQALQTLMESNNIDPFDLTKEKESKDEYAPTVYGKNDTEIGIEEVTKNIENDAEYKFTVDIVNNQWDDSSRASLSSNPNMIQGLHNDIKSGVYDKVAPEAMKMKVLDGNTKSDLDYYMLAGEKVLNTNAQEPGNTDNPSDSDSNATQDTEDNFDQASSEADRKRSASSTRSRTDRKGVVDYLDDNDEDFDEWYKNLEASN